MEGISIIMLQHPSRNNILCEPAPKSVVLKRMHLPASGYTIPPKNSENRIQYKESSFSFIDSVELKVAEVHPVLREPKTEKNLLRWMFFRMAVPEVNLRQGEGQILASGKLAFRVTVLGIPDGMGNAHTEPFEVFLRSRVLMVFVISLVFSGCLVQSW